MTDIEIDKALALAIGWKDEPNKMRVSTLWGLQVWIGLWVTFSHKDWNVIGPIGERYNMFPWCCAGWWNVAGYGQPSSKTPQKAIALAVIGAKK